MQHDPSKKNLESVAGTLFIDEINSISRSSQAKLLRTIEEKKVKVLGDEKTHDFEAKIICASNMEGLDSSEQWSGRSDLFYRFKQIIRLPALREMKDSIPEIALEMAKLC